ncbi:hypothetical protein C8E87_5302 [Paractinoplanes brasiliensis]|uniref:Uncharacterized protein n=1 Tax=Paractinoplanes brasiliensis TaxID=52695 RepID=A0A4R6K1S9_9ACTN|nr:hypothetical protein C8E87_5302 [Actinoplanes brasiliensis]
MVKPVVAVQLTARSRPPWPGLTSGPPLVLRPLAGLGVGLAGVSRPLAGLSVRLSLCMYRLAGWVGGFCWVSRGWLAERAASAECGARWRVGRAALAECRARWLAHRVGRARLRPAVVNEWWAGWRCVWWGSACGLGGSGWVSGWRAGGRHRRAGPCRRPAAVCERSDESERNRRGASARPTTQAGLPRQKSWLNQRVSQTAQGEGGSEAPPCNQRPATKVLAVTGSHARFGGRGDH